MMSKGRSRKGVASVIGALFMVIIFMLGVGAQAYMSGVQAQSNQAVQAAQQAAFRKSSELIAFSTPGAGVTVANGGPTALSIISMIIEFENGSVYSLGQRSTPAFTPVTLPQGANLLLRALVPAGVCKDQSGAGTAACLSKYDATVNNAVAGREVGLVTSMGNVFWYSPSASVVKWSQLTGFPAACAEGQFISALASVPTCTTAAGTAVRVVSNLTNSAYGSWMSALSVQLGPNANYVFEAYLSVYSTGSGGWNIKVRALPTGAALQLGCVVYGLTSVSGNVFCNHKAGVPPQSSGFGVGQDFIQYYGTVTMGSVGGPLEIDFVNFNSPGSTTVVGGSFMLVQRIP